MARRNVLVVEDDRLIAWCIVRTLAPNELAVRAVESVREAVTEIAGGAYDLVFLDLQLPDGTGFDVLRSIRELSPRTRAVVVSGDGTESNRARALAEGAVRFVEKPFACIDIELAARDALDEPAGPVLPTGSSAAP